MKRRLSSFFSWVDGQPSLIAIPLLILLLIGAATSLIISACGGYVCITGACFCLSILCANLLWGLDAHSVPMHELVSILVFWSLVSIYPSCILTFGKYRRR